MIKKIHQIPTGRPDQRILYKEIYKKVEHNLPFRSILLSQQIIDWKLKKKKSVSIT